MAIAEQVRMLSDQELLDHKEEPVSASEFRIIQCEYKVDGQSCITTFKLGGNQPIFRSIRHVMKVSEQQCWNIITLCTVDT